jgi:predicted CxxxxCH...CXXCH cytochrome family protein
MRALRVSTLAVAIAALVTGCDTARDLAPQSETSCARCHGFPPPPALAGQVSATDPQVGAHERHVEGVNFSDGFSCAVCHPTPGTPPSHQNGTVDIALAGAGERLLPAELGTYTRTPTTQTCAVYCHGATIVEEGVTKAPPVWTAAASLACNSCHGLPPVSPGLHTFTPHVKPCAFCHIGYTANANVSPPLHVNGVKNVLFPSAANPGTFSTHQSGWTDCNGCHTANANCRNQDNTLHCPIF